MKKVLDKTASRCYNKQVAGQPADERRTLKIEQYRILVTEPFYSVLEHFENSKEVIHRTQAIAC